MRIYLDHNATTPVRDEVTDAVARALRDCFGNPSSTHAFGAEARAALERAREQVAAALGAEPDEVVFTAGATEANNSVLFGAPRRGAPRGRHVVSTSIEHPSVSAPLAALETQGWRVTKVAPDAEGRVAAADVAAAIRDDTQLVSLIWANNETGVIQPVAEVAERARARGVLLHVDATQALGKIPVDLGAVPADLLALSGHKFNAPKGVGCLVVRRGVRLDPWMRGGSQERRRRGGTENLPGAVGLGVACELARREVDERAASYARLRDRLWEGIAAKVPGVRRNGRPDEVLPNTLNVELEDTPGDVLAEALDLEGVAVSTGAACASGSIEPSPVLLAMGRSPRQALGSIRFSVGHGVTEAQIDRVIALLPDLVARVRDSAGA